MKYNDSMIFYKEHPYDHEWQAQESRILCRLREQSANDTTMQRFMQARAIFFNYKAWPADPQTGRCRMTRPQFDKALAELKDVGEDGCAQACYWVARLYGDRDNPFGIFNPEESFRWMELAAREIPEACYALAFYWLRGFGAPRPTSESDKRAIVGKILHLLTSASDGGVYPAHWTLQNFYERGFLVDKDTNKVAELENNWRQQRHVTA